jgi:predicted MFS family arabinose efflux permease
MEMELARGHLRGQVTVATAARLVLSMGYRIPYPFLPHIAEGLGVPLKSAGILITLLLSTGLLSPLFGPYSDRFGRRRMVVAGMVVASVGASIIFAAPTLVVVGLGFVLLGAGKVIFDPSLRAYLGDLIAYETRGRVLAITELAWAGGLLIGAPAAGWVIRRWGWRGSFAIIAILSVLGAVAIRLALFADHDERDVSRPEPAGPQPVRTVLRSRAAVSALGFTALIMLAYELLFVVYGAWMETAFGLSIGRLGAATIIVGVGELIGEISAGGLVDRMGKRRAVAVGLAATCLCYLVWPLTSSALVPAIACLFVLLLTFEFTYVAAVPLMTELVVEARATLLSFNVAAEHLGRSLGALIALPLWASWGLWGNGLTAGTAILLALGLLMTFIKGEKRVL